VGTILYPALVAEQFQESFVDEGGGLQGMLTCFPAHVTGGQPSQFCVNRLKKKAASFRVTVSYS
jgi:hypothetical protein